MVVGVFCWSFFPPWVKRELLNLKTQHKLVLPLLALQIRDQKLKAALRHALPSLTRHVNPPFTYDNQRWTRAEVRWLSISWRKHALNLRMVVNQLPRIYSYLPSQPTPCVPAWSRVPTHRSFSLWQWSKQQSRSLCWKTKKGQRMSRRRTTKQVVYAMFFFCLSVKIISPSCAPLAY